MPEPAPADVRSLTEMVLRFWLELFGFNGEDLGISRDPDYAMKETLVEH